MRYLKYFLYFLFALISVLLIVGLIVKKIEYSASITVDKPVKEVWAVYQDENKMKEWLEGFETIELVKGNKNEIGSEYLVKINQEGQVIEMKEILNDFEEFKNVNFDFDNDFMLMNYDVEFSENQGTTTIKTHSIVKGHGIMMRAFMPFIKSSMIAQEEKNLAALKEVIEANQTDYYPKAQEVEETEMQENE